jgi:hypothetical protein
MSFIGQQTESQLINIYCEIQCRPDLIKIQWFNGTKLLNLTNGNHLSIVLTRYMHRNNIICQARNQVGIRNQSITLQVNCMALIR